MLGRIVELNKTIAELKRHKWEIEENLLNLEKRMIELERACKKIFKDDKPQIDFEKIKIPELEKRIEVLSRNVPKSGQEAGKFLSELQEIKTLFERSRTDYAKTLESLGKPLTQLEAYNKSMRDKLHGLRGEINNLPDADAKITTISELDGIVSLKMLMMMLDEIRHVNELDVFESFQKLTGKDLRALKKGANFDEICSKLGVDIKSTFEALTKRDTREITEQTIRGLTQKLIGEFLAAAQKKLSIGKVQNEGTLEALKGYLATQIYLTCVLETYKFTDDVQMGITTAQISFATWMSTPQVYNPFVAICHSAKQIQVNPKTEALFSETALWLRGLYQRSYNQVPPFMKDAAKNVTPRGFHYIGDDEERSLYKYHPPLTKVLMADKHKYHSDVIFAKLSPEHQLKPAEEKRNAAAAVPAPSVPHSQPVPVPGATAPVPMPDKIEPLENILPGIRSLNAAPQTDGNSPRPRLPSTPASLLQAPEAIPQPIHIMKADDHYNMTLSLHKNETEKFDRLAVVVGKVMEQGVVNDNSALRKVLSACQSDPPEARIAKLKECVRMYQLNNSQCASLLFIPMIVNETFPGYSEGTRYGFFWNKHAEDARAAVAKINASPNPRVQLEVLFSLRKDMNKKGSRTLLGLTDACLLHAFNLLCGSNEMLDQSKPADSGQNRQAGSVQLNMIGDYRQMLIKLHKDEVERLNKLEVVVGKVMEHGVVTNEVEMRKELALLEDSLDDEETKNDKKIKKLKDCIRKYELTPNQTASLLFLPDTAAEALDKYITESRSRFVYIPRKHAELAKQILDEIKTMDDARLQLEKLFALRKVLKTDGSKNALPELNRVLLRVYKILSGTAKPEPAMKPAV